jgi:hypothetical protein
MAHAHDRTLLSSLAFGDPDKKEPLHDLACQYIARPEVVRAMGRTHKHSFTVSPCEGWEQHPTLEKHWYRGQEVLPEIEIASRPGQTVQRDLPIEVSSAAFDSMLVKGEGRYATTIGFIDVVITQHVTFFGCETKKQTGFCVFETRAEAEQYLKLWGKGMYADDYLTKVDAVSEASLKREVQHDWRAQERIAQEGLTAPAPEGWRTPKFLSISDRNTRERIPSLFVEVKIKEVSLGDVLRQVNLYRGYAGLQYGATDWLVACAFEMSSSFVDGLRSQNIQAVHLGENFRKWAAQQRSVAPAAPVLSL